MTFRFQIKGCYYGDVKLLTYIPFHFMHNILQNGGLLIYYVSTMPKKRAFITVLLVELKKFTILHFNFRFLAQRGSTLQFNSYRQNVCLFAHLLVCRLINYHSVANRWVSRIITEYFKILIENDRIPIIIILDFFFGDF